MRAATGHGGEIGAAGSKEALAEDERILSRVGARTERSQSAKRPYAHGTHSVHSMHRRERLAEASPRNASFSVRWQRHLIWQQQQLAQMASPRSKKPPRFLLLRPGDKLTVCDPGGLRDLRGRCHKAPLPPTWRDHQPKQQHWDPFLLGTISARHQHTRPLPGLGNVALSLVAAAVTAMVSRRVLLLENFSMPGASFGAPIRDLLVETSGWAPHLVTAGQSGGVADGFAAHDDNSAFDGMCRSNLRHWPPERVWRVFSNQYFLPLLLLNPYHSAHVEAMAEPALRRGDDSAYPPPAMPSLWVPAIRALWRPRPRLLTQLNTFLRESELDTAPFVAMHARLEIGSGRLDGVLRCVRARLAARNASRLFLASMHTSNRKLLSDALGPSGITVVTFGRAVGAQSESRSGTDAALADMYLMGQSAEVMVNAGSTFAYVVHGLSGGEAIRYGGTHTSAQFAGHGRSCEDVGTREASFHLIADALRSSSACRMGEREARRRSSALYAASILRH